MDRIVKHLGIIIDLQYYSFFFNLLGAKSLSKGRLQANGTNTRSDEQERAVNVPLKHPTQRKIKSPKSPQGDLNPTPVITALTHQARDLRAYVLV